ncbi:hypothetical protein [Herpetosiphon llansteffanensis]|uniref:hypothetical protein n=1 Tax=Herpetosiphon llansteffanensis TaxID=2094568 RepID=UPI000F51A36E|nr:hypothetical protein [Herpetosiphon llansteffanensis]
MYGCHPQPLVMQRQADELYQLHSSLRAASPIRLNIFWDIPNLSQCVWRFSVVWSTDNLGCPAPRPTSSGNFTFIPQASR